MQTGFNGEAASNIVRDNDMKLWFVVCYIISSLTLLYPMTGYAQATPIPWEDWCKDDVRLAQTVNFSGSPFSFSPLYSGQLMEELTRQTGVSLTVTDRDGGAGEPLVVSLRNVPLCKVLESYWSLVSYKDSSWRLTRLGIAPNFRYIVERPVAARNLCQKIQGDIQNDFEKYAETLVKGAALPPVDREKLVKSDPLLASLLNEAGTREGISLFANQTSEEQRLQVIRGEKRLTAPLSQFSDAERERLRNLRKMIGGFYVLPDGSKKPFYEPKTIQFKTEKTYNALTPTLFIDYGEMGALSYIGNASYESKWQQKIRDGWFLPGDDRERPEASDLPLNEHEISTLPKRKEPRTLFEQLDRFASVAQISFMGHLPPGDIGLLKPQAGKVSSLLAEMRADATIPLMYKWRGKVLLVTYPYWFTQDAAKRNASWEAVKKLRDLKGNPDVEDLFHLASMKQNNTFEALAEEFPAIRFIQQWRKVLRWVSQSPQRREAFLSRQGIRVTEDMLEILATSKTDSYQSPDTDWIKRARRARLAVTDNVDNKGNSHRLFQIMIYDKDGMPLVGSGADFTPVAPPDNLEQPE